MPPSPLDNVSGRKGKDCWDVMCAGVPSEPWVTESRGKAKWRKTRFPGHEKGHGTHVFGVGSLIVFGWCVCVCARDKGICHNLRGFGHKMGLCWSKTGLCWNQTGLVS